MIVSHHLANDLGAFSVGAIRSQAHVAHTDENPPVNRLQAVSYIRQCPPNDDAHGVVDVRPPHLVLDIYRNEIIQWGW